MTHGQSLAQMTQATHQSITARLNEVLAADHVHGPRETQRCTDAFLAATSRHLAAVDEVLLPPVRSTVPQGDQLVREYLRVARRLESDLSLLKARLYGEAHSVRLSWSDLVHTTQANLSRHDSLETELVDQLLVHGRSEELDELAQQVFRGELRAPTRPHPHIPHTGRFGVVARRLWALADRFWDSAQGRMVPEPVRPTPHRHDSLLAQYMVADPHFDDRAALMEHRHRHPEA